MELPAGLSQSSLHTFKHSAFFPPPPLFLKVKDSCNLKRKHKSNWLSGLNFHQLSSFPLFRGLVIASKWGHLHPQNQGQVANYFWRSPSADSISCRCRIVPAKEQLHLYHRTLHAARYQDRSSPVLLELRGVPLVSAPMACLGDFLLNI